LAIADRHRWYELMLGLIVAMLALPAAAAAQGGLGGGGMGSGRHDMGAPPTHRELDAHMLALIRADDPNNPVSLMMAARPDLKLSDSEMTALGAVQMELQRNQAAGRTALDTLGPNTPIRSINFAQLTPAGRDSLINHRKAVAAANAQIHDAAVLARQHALEVLTPDQQRHFLDLENKVRIERDTPHDSTEKH
jgi:hypothetical protein